MNVLRLNHENKDRFNSMLNKRCIVLFFHPQCMHCIELKPTWEKLKQQNVNSPLNILEVNAEMLHDLNHPVKNSVRGFPQIVSLENGQVKKEFTQPRTLENLNTFVNNSSKSLSNQIEELSKNMLFKNSGFNNSKPKSNSRKSKPKSKAKSKPKSKSKSKSKSKAKSKSKSKAKSNSRKSTSKSKKLI